MRINQSGFIVLRKFRLKPIYNRQLHEYQNLVLMHSSSKGCLPSRILLLLDVHSSNISLKHLRACTKNIQLELGMVWHVKQAGDSPKLIIKIYD